MTLPNRVILSFRALALPAALWPSQLPIQVPVSRILQLAPLSTVQYSRFRFKFLAPVRGLFVSVFVFSRQNSNAVIGAPPIYCVHLNFQEPFQEPVFLNDYGAHKSISRNEFRQPMSPVGPVR